MRRGLIVAIVTFCCMVVLADAPLKVERRKPLTANVGVVSVGLDTYWKQCPGLYDDMLKKTAVFENVRYDVEEHPVEAVAV